MHRTWTPGAAIALLAIGGCSGSSDSGGDSSNPPPPPPPPPPTTTVGGLWSGALWWDPSDGFPAGARNIRALVAETGEYRIVLYDDDYSTAFSGQSEQAYGTVKVEDDRITTLGDGLWLTASDDATTTGISWAAFGMIGDIRSRQSMDAEFQAVWANGELRSGTLSATYHSLYANPSSLEILRGTYSTDDEVMTIDIDGSIFYQSSATGCTGAGIAEVIDPDYNMYRFTVDVDGCTGNEVFRNALTFTGLANMGVNNEPGGGFLNETLEIAASAVHTDIMGSSYVGWNMLLHED